MTPKEKAEELIIKFEMSDAWGELERGQKIDYALIAVNEIIKAGKQHIVEQYFDDMFWNEVIKELETL